MKDCQPAEYVYPDSPVPGLTCLPETGLDLLTIVLFGIGFTLMGIGMVLMLRADEKRRREVEQPIKERMPLGS